MPVMLGRSFEGGTHPTTSTSLFFSGYTILLKRFADSAKNFSAKNLGIFLTYFVYLLQRDLYYLWPV